MVHVNAFKLLLEYVRFFNTTVMTNLTGLPVVKLLHELQDKFFLLTLIHKHVSYNTKSPPKRCFHSATLFPTACHTNFMQYMRKEKKEGALSPLVLCAYTSPLPLWIDPYTVHERGREGKNYVIFQPICLCLPPSPLLCYVTQDPIPSIGTRV